MLKQTTVLTMAMAITASAHSAFLRVKITTDAALNAQARTVLAAAGVPNADTATVLRIYAVFDGPAGRNTAGVDSNTVVATYNVDLSPATGSGLVFFQVPTASGGLDSAPNSGFFPHFPTLQFDTFGTIGVLDASNGDPTIIGQNTSMSQLHITGGWNIGNFLQGGASFDFGDGTYGTLLFQITTLGPSPQCSQNLNSFINGSISMRQFVSAALPPLNLGAQLGPFAPGCTGDLVGDSIAAVPVVDSSDLGTMLSQWGPADPCATSDADLNQDGVVDSGDLSLLLGNWGGCPNPHHHP